jgi:hypothetical protein
MRPTVLSIPPAAGLFNTILLLLLFVATFSVDSGLSSTQDSRQQYKSVPVRAYVRATREAQLCAATGVHPTAKLCHVSAKRAVRRPNLCLRGGSSDVFIQDSSDIPSEGRAVPGAGVEVEEGYLEKRKRGEDPGDHAEVERFIQPTWDEAVKEREQWFAENPDYVEPVNETWFFEVRRGNVTTLGELLRQGASVEFVDEYGDRAIHLAAIDDDVVVLKFLLSQGAAINARNTQGNTALHIATEYGQLDMMEVLIGHGAALEERNYAKATALVTACVHDQIRCIELLASAGADMHTRALKDTPALHFAAANNCAAAIRTLVKLGVDPNATTPLGRNAMDWAYYSNQEDAIEELSKHGVPIQDGGQLPRLELQRWALQKMQRSGANKASDKGEWAEGEEDGSPAERAVRGEAGDGRLDAGDGWFPRASAEPLVLSPLVLPEADDDGSVFHNQSDARAFVHED